MSNAQTQVQQMKEELDSILSNIQKHKIFLDKIAHEVHGLLANKSYRERFEQHYQKFLKKWVAWREVERQWYEKIAEYRSKANKNKRLRDKQSGPPRNGYTWYDCSPLNTGDPRYGFWGPVCEERTPNPCFTLHPITANGIPPTNHEDELKKYYVLLAAIHDWMLPSCPLIYDGTCPELLNLLASVIELNLNDEGQGVFETALERVKTDLARTEGNKRSIIAWIVEVIIALALLVICLYFFGVVTGIFVFAALLTIFHLLGWLEPIRAFIYNIVSHN